MKVFDRNSRKEEIFYVKKKKSLRRKKELQSEVKRSKLWRISLEICSWKLIKQQKQLKSNKKWYKRNINIKSHKSSKWIFLSSLKSFSLPITEWKKNCSKVGRQTQFGYENLWNSRGSNFWKWKFSPKKKRLKKKFDKEDFFPAIDEKFFLSTVVYMCVCGNHICFNLE